MMAINLPVSSVEVRYVNTRFSWPASFNDFVSIDSIREGLAHSNIAKNRIGEIEGEVLVAGSFRLHDLQAGIVFQDFDHIRRQHVQGDVDGTFAKLQGAHDCFGNQFEAQHGNARFVSEIVFVPLQQYFVIQDVVHKLEWSGSNRMTIKVGGGAIRNDAKHGERQIPEKR